MTEHEAMWHLCPQALPGKCVGKLCMAFRVKPPRWLATNFQGDTWEIDKPIDGNNRPAKLLPEEVYCGLVGEP
jgi:hypothetical protein